MPNPPRLSKSRFQSGRQCALKLWHDVHSPELRVPPDEALQWIFDRGNRVGELAQDRYPGGRLIEAGYRHPARALEETAAALAEAGQPDATLSAIFEPAVEHQNVFARIDVLLRVGDEWDLLEVKSAANAKDVYESDVAVQYWIARNAGLPIRRAGLLLLNRDYLYDGVALDLQELFRVHDVTEACEARFAQIGDQVDELQAMLAADQAPDISPGPQCTAPYTCMYWDHCTQGMTVPEHPVSNLPRVGAAGVERFREDGIETIPQIPDDYSLTAQQERVRRCVMTGEEWVSDGLSDALDKIRYPVHHLDFESMMPAVPRFGGTHPFEQLPFQFSIHTQDEPGGPAVHREYLCTDGGDPRRPLAEALLDGLDGEDGEGTSTILHYAPFERTMIKYLARVLPDLSEPLLALLGRCVDLCKIMQSHYYHPGFGGSFSIKAVLPVMVPELSYDGLEISDGREASRRYEQALELEDDAERAAIFDALRLYCAQDTLAMARLLEVLGGKG